jgi:hypothetical protein
MVQVLAIRENHGRKGTGVPILADWEHGHVTIEGKIGCGLLGPFAKRLSFFRTIDAGETDWLGSSIVHDAERITVGDADDMAGEFGSEA